MREPDAAAEAPPERPRRRSPPALRGPQEVLALAVVDELRAPQAAAALGMAPVAPRLRLSRVRRPGEDQLVMTRTDDLTADPRPARPGRDQPTELPHRTGVAVEVT